MRTNIRLFCITIVALMAVSLKGQQIPPLSQYNLNHYMINPAATGISDKLPLAFMYRKSWAGIKSAPSLQYLSGHTLITDDMAMGAKIFNYQTGPIRKTGLEATYSYHISLDAARSKLSFGLTGLLYQYYFNMSELNIEEPGDEVFMGTDQMIIPDASFGMYLYGEEYFIGVAVPQLFNRNIDLKTDRILQQKQVRHYYIHGGYNFELGSEFELEPSVLLKFVEAGLFQADINAMVNYLDMVQFGLSYRTSDAVVIQIGYRNNDLQIGYSYDLTLSDLKTVSSGSHEIVLIYSLPDLRR